MTKKEMTVRAPAEGAAIGGGSQERAWGSRPELSNMWLSSPPGQPAPGLSLSPGQGTGGTSSAFPTGLEGIPLLFTDRMSLNLRHHGV